MQRCPSCRTVSALAGAAFCAHCGARMVAGPPSPTSTTARLSTWPPAAVVLDVVGAIRAAGFALAALAAVPLIVAIIALVRTPALGPGGVVGIVAAGVAHAVGGSTRIDGTVLGTAVSATVGVMPLTPTALGLTVLGWTWARALPRESEPGAMRRAILHGAATLVLFVGGLALVAALGGIALTAAAGAVSGVPDGVAVGVVVDVVRTALGGLLLGGATLSVTVLWRRPGLLPDRARSWRDAAAGPVIAVRVSVGLAALALVVFALVGVVADAATSSPSLGEGLRAVLGVLLIAGPNAVVYGLGLGSGAPVDLSVSGLPEILRPTTVPRLFGLLDMARGSGWAWLLPGVVAVCLLAGAVRMAQAAPRPQTALRWGWVLGPVWAVALLLGAFLAGVQVTLSGRLPILGPVTASATAHPGYGGVVLAGLVWGAIAGTLGAVVAPLLPAGRGTVNATSTGTRRAAVLVPAVALVCLLSITAGWATLRGPRTLDASPVTSTPDGVRAVPSADPPAVAPFSGTAALDPSLSDDGTAATVQPLLSRYFDAINARDYATWSTLVTSAVARDQPEGDWRRAYRSTVTDQVAIRGVLPIPSGTVLTTVTFRSTQDPAGSTCWRMTYPVELAAGRVGQPQKSSTVSDAC